MKKYDNNVICSLYKNDKSFAQLLLNTEKTGKPDSDKPVNFIVADENYELANEWEEETIIYSSINIKPKLTL